MKRLFIGLLLLLPFISMAQVIITGTGEIVASGTANIVLTGDWTNNNTTDGNGFTGSTSGGKVYFKGSSMQTVGGSNFYTKFGVAEIDNSAGMTLNSIAAFTNFTFVNGIITSTSSAPFYVMDGGIILGAGASKFVNGPMSKVGNTDFKFDIGEGTKYAPIEVIGLTTNTTVGAVYHKSTPSNKTNLKDPLTKVSDVEYWVIDDVTGGGLSPNADADVNIYWENANESGIKSIDSDSLKFARLVGTTWNADASTIHPGSSTGTGSGFIGTNSKFSLNNTNVTFGSTNDIANPLPIQLLSFTAKCQQQDVVIEWSTASEENNDYFTLLRSDDAKHYEEIAQIIGAGNSNTVVNYSYKDWNAAGGNYYYMLKQTDFDGKNDISSPVFVSCKETKEVSLKILYDANQVYALLSNAENGARYNMIVIDYTGKIIMQEKQTVNSKNYYHIPKQSLASGLYSIVYYLDNGTIKLNEKFFVR